MLSPEAAAKQLEQWQHPSVNEDDSAGLVELIGRLPTTSRAIAFAFHDRDLNGKELEWNDWRTKHQQKRLAGSSIENWRPAQRLKFFEHFFPVIAEDVERGWNFLKSIPYPRGHARKSFRAPNHPQSTLPKRLAWLESLMYFPGRYRQDVQTLDWFAAWAPHFKSYYLNRQDHIGLLLASVLDSGGFSADAVFEILRESLANQHEIGGMGSHVIRAFLACSRPDCWELMEKTLLAAQRQEGLRQAILETIDEAHPQAYRRMLRLIQEHDLARFSSVARAVDDWFGFSWDSASAKKFNDVIERAIKLLDDPGERNRALEGDDAETAYLALWSIAFEDARVAVSKAKSLLERSEPELRYVGVVFLDQVRLPETIEPRTAMLDDPDLRVAWQAFSDLQFGDESDDADEFAPVKKDQSFERLERFYLRVPEKPTKSKTIVWPWTVRQMDRQEVIGKMLDALGNRPPTRMLQYLPSLSPTYRYRLVQRLTEQKKWDRLTRDALIDLSGDASKDVRRASYEALANHPLQAGEATRLESYLSRSASDLRRGIVTLLANAKDADALASADRLLHANDAPMRLAGLEILRQLAEADRRRSDCQARGADYRAARKKLSKDEETQLVAIEESGRERWTLENALGLMNPDERTPFEAPKDRKAQFITGAAIGCMKSLDVFIHEHRETSVRFRDDDEERDELLGELSSGFPYSLMEKLRQTNVQDFPLRELWEKWEKSRSRLLRDNDGLELIRAQAWAHVDKDDWSMWWLPWSKRSPDHRKIAGILSGGNSHLKLRYEDLVQDILRWLAFRNPPSHTMDSFLDSAESAAALATPKMEQMLVELDSDDGDDEFGMNPLEWRWPGPYNFWFELVDYIADSPQVSKSPEQWVRMWKLFRWYDEPVPGARRRHLDRALLEMVHAAGEATAADWYDMLLGRRSATRWGTTFTALNALTDRRLGKRDAEFLAKHPEVAGYIENCRQRVLDIELARGAEPTPATAVAKDIDSYFGTEVLLRTLSALGNRPFKIDYRREERDAVLTYLIGITFPNSTDTLTDFVTKSRQAVGEGRIPENRILELAFHAPQWCKFIEEFLQWQGFCEGLYWFLAHMKYLSVDSDLVAFDASSDDSSDDDSEDKPSAWNRLIGERTPLTNQERREGAVDVNWFHTIYAQLTPSRWEAMAKAARYASSPAMAKRAQFVADVLLGKASRKELFEGIRKRFLKENVRLLGLLPLAKGDKRDKDVAERYKVLVEYRKYAKQLSAMSKEDAVRASEVGFQNLARTAGYADPLRLEWAMEAESVKDLAKGSVEATRDGVTVRLELDESSRPTLTVRRGEKELKSIPPEIKKKDKAIAALAERVPELKRQSSRMRQSLEAAMCRGDSITPAELVQLCDHALLKPMLGRLVFVGDGILGYPDKGGKALRNSAGKLEPIKKTESLRIAHPHDFLASGDWDAWQRDCFQAERVQPFKQIFRELYVVTKQEKSDGTLSRRYAGQQVNPTQATALWGQRGWSTKDGVWKTFYDVGITASVGFNYGVTTPLEVEGWTIETVQFTQRDSYERLKLTAVPPRIFSEVMRDLDLVVSVAHRGQVDPEASASTVEMRANLLDETCRLLQFKNVRIKNQHALVDGELGKYSVHLGSAVVHKMPGGSLCIVPVHAQHRGRLFLPFADDDPKTAEVISKVLLLARDAEIQDPIILDQLRHVGV